MSFLTKFVVSVLLFLAVFPCSGKDRAGDWPSVGNDKGGMRYSKLTQINRKNVKSLEVAWTYHTGDAAKGNGSTIECTPIVIEGVMFITTAKSKVVALDADTGIERWKFDPYDNFKVTQPLASGGVNRGVAYWSEGKESRIFLGAADGRLYVGHVGLDPGHVDLVAPTGTWEVALPRVAAHSVEPDLAHSIGQLWILSRDHAALSDRKVLGRIEAEARGR